MIDIVERLSFLRPTLPGSLASDAADEITRLRAERDQLRQYLDAAQRRGEELRAQVAALEGDAERWRYVKSIARQNTAYDYYGNGGLWTIGLHSDDNRLPLDAVADAARKGG